MARNNITLVRTFTLYQGVCLTRDFQHVVACEPTLSKTKVICIRIIFAHLTELEQRGLDFYTGLTAKTGYVIEVSHYNPLIIFFAKSGQVLPLGDLTGLTSLITGSLTEAVSLSIQAALSRSAVDYKANVGVAAQELYEHLRSANVQIDTLVTDDYYEDIPEARKNAELWAKGKKVADVRGHIQPVRINICVRTNPHFTV